MSRSETPLWKQVDVAYFRRRPAFRAWRRRLYIAGPVVAASLLLLMTATGSRRLFSSGSMSRGHSFLEDQCAKCHTDSWQSLQGLFRSAKTDSVRNEACLTCHGGTIGFDESTFSSLHWVDSVKATGYAPKLACHQCHREHEGVPPLSEVADSECVGCHANLRAHAAETTFAPNITAFASDHIDFRRTRPGTADFTTIKLNHKVHLKPDLLGPGGPTQLNCDDCHRAGRSLRPWRFGQPTTHEDDQLDTDVSGPILQAAYMNPIRYSLHCKSCHPLVVDRVRWPFGEKGIIPHESPAVVRAFLRGELAGMIKEKPDILRERKESLFRDRPQLRELPLGEENKLVVDWIEEQLAVIEQTIYDGKKMCLYCHDQEQPASPADLVAIVPPKVPQRWFAHSSFSHERHRVVSCVACHDRTEQSVETFDVLIPPIETCRSCHAPRHGEGDVAIGGVAFNCTLCHTYHRPPNDENHRPTTKNGIDDLVSDFGATEADGSPR
ncbi:MAG: cytochrome c3 family protein [Planctomycetota bacterium]